MNFSSITEDLIVGSCPGRRDFDTLRGLGVSLVINMRWRPGPRPAADDPALRYLWFRTFDNPLLPIPLRVLIDGVREALAELERGGKLYIHCARGRHRSVAMAASILVAQGLEPFEAMALIKERRPTADPTIYYIRRRIELFAGQWASLQQMLTEQPQEGILQRA